MVAVIALVVAAGGGAYAVIPDRNGRIDACYGPNGQLRVIDAEAKERCRPSERSLAWSQRGPAGPPGAAGPAGPAGPQGPAGPAGSSGRGVVARARGSSELFVTHSDQTDPSTWPSYPVSDNQWTQAANEVDEMVGRIHWVASTCNPGTGSSVTVLVYVNGKIFGRASGFPDHLHQGGTVVQDFRVKDARVRDPGANQTRLQESILFEPGQATQRTVTVKLATDCGHGARIKSLALDVIGTR